MTKKQKNSPKLYKSPKHHNFMMFSDNSPEPREKESSNEAIVNSQSTATNKESSEASEYNMSGMTKLLEMYLEAVTINESNYNNINKKLEKISYKLDSLTKDKTNKRDKLLDLKSQLIKEQSLVKNKTKELLENIAHATYTASQEL